MQGSGFYPSNSHTHITYTLIQTHTYTPQTHTYTTQKRRAERDGDRTQKLAQEVRQEGSDERKWAGPEPGGCQLHLPWSLAEAPPAGLGLLHPSPPRPAELSSRHAGGS